MTPKKAIVRQPVYTLDDGSPVPSMGHEFTMRESRFIFWYTSPGTEAFMNSGRAAARAGYKGNAVMQGYLLKQKPRIAEKINSLLIPVQAQLHDAVWRIAFLCEDRMFFKVADFFRPCKRTVKVRGKEIEVDSYEIIPIDEISERNRMCIDQVDVKTIHGRDEFWYKLPNRDKAADTFFKCLEVLYGKTKAQIIADLIAGRDFTNGGDDDMHWKKTAEFLRGDDARPVIAPNPKNAIEAP